MKKEKFLSNCLIAKMCEKRYLYHNFLPHFCKIRQHLQTEAHIFELEGGKLLFYKRRTGKNEKNKELKEPDIIIMNTVIQ